MRTVDAKSILIGLVLGLCIFLALGAADGRDASIGRYQIACPDSQNTCFVIDTRTGQVWQRYSDGRGNQYGSPDLWNQ